VNEIMLGTLSDVRRY